MHKQFYVITSSGSRYPVEYRGHLLKKKPVFTISIKGVNRDILAVGKGRNEFEIIDKHKKEGKSPSYHDLKPGNYIVFSTARKKGEVSIGHTSPIAAVYEKVDQKLDKNMMLVFDSKEGPITLDASKVRFYQKG